LSTLWVIVLAFNAPRVGDPSNLGIVEAASNDEGVKAAGRNVMATLHGQIMLRGAYQPLLFDLADAAYGAAMALRPTVPDLDEHQLFAVPHYEVYFSERCPVVARFEMQTPGFKKLAREALGLLTDGRTAVV
jgi:hypothetical protein